MKKFEYKSIETKKLSDGISKPSVKELNSLGSEGWELIQVLEDVCLFKREVIQGFLNARKISLTTKEVEEFRAIFTQSDNDPLSEIDKLLGKVNDIADKWAKR